MISKNHRFHGLGSLRFVYGHGKTVREPKLGLKYAMNNRRQTYRVAVVVSRKVHKSAVVRNRIRRRIYEIIRLHEDQISKPYDLVFIAFSEQLTRLEPNQLEKLVIELLRKANVTPEHDIVSKKED